MQSLSTAPVQLTVGQLADFLIRLLVKKPDAKDWKVSHVEFGGATDSTYVEVDEKDQEICIS